MVISLSTLTLTANHKKRASRYFPSLLIKRHQPKAVPESDAPFSQVVTDDRYAYLAGLVAADFPQGRAVLGDPEKETTAVMQVIFEILEEMGLDFCDIVRADVHLCDLRYFDQMDSAYRRFFEGAAFPARTTTESPRLFGGASVEITVQARLRT